MIAKEHLTREIHTQHHPHRATARASTSAMPRLVSLPPRHELRDPVEYNAAQAATAFKPNNAP